MTTPFKLYRTAFEYRTQGIADAYDSMMTTFNGVLLLLAAFGPRLFNFPGRNLQLHPDDYRPEGQNGPGMNERWLGWPNIPDTGVLGVCPQMERMGLAHAFTGDFRGIVPINAMIEECHRRMLNPLRWKHNHGPGFGDKYFDNGVDAEAQAQWPDHQGDLGHHGHKLKREGYSFHDLMNRRYNNCGVTSVGLLPHITFADVMEYFLCWDDRDNQVRQDAYQMPIKMGTGAQMDRNRLHGPGGSRVGLATHENSGPGPVGLLTDDFYFVQNRIGGKNGQRLGKELGLRHTAGDMPDETRATQQAVAVDVDFQKAFNPAHYVLLPMPIERYSGEDALAEAYWSLYGLNTGDQAFSHQYFCVKAGANAQIHFPDYATVHFLQGSGKFAGNKVRGISDDSIRLGRRVSEDADDEAIVPYETAKSSGDGIRVEADSGSDLVFTLAFGPDAWSRNEFPLAPWQSWGQANALVTK